MVVSICLSAWWAVEVGTLAGLLDAFLSGGGVVFAQAIYRNGAPRDDALHRKLDSIIHGTDADDELAGIERNEV